MNRPALPLLGLLVAAFGVAAGIKPGLDHWRGGELRSNDILALVFGESRKMFARHLFAKADAYFHSGYYPSVFDEKSGDHGEAVTGAGGGEVCDFLAPPRDWIERFGRNFFPSEHRHLGEGGGHGEHEGHCEGHGEAHEHGACEHGTSGPGREREMLPWFQLAATLDPERPETYVVAAFWLRTLEKPDEAEAFVRQGLRANPGNPELLFELGRFASENHADPDRARNLWELALARWRGLSDEQRESRILLHALLLGNLAKLEEQAGRADRAIHYLQELHTISPNKKQIEDWIKELES